MRISTGLGFAFASLVGWLIGAFNHTATLADYWPILPAFGLGMGLGMIAFQIPQWWVWLWVQIAEAEHAKADARQYRGLWLAEKETKRETTIDPDAQRLYRWVEFWTTCLEYVAAHEDRFTYQGCLKDILTWPSFEKAFAEPLEDKQWLYDSTERASTTPREGWTAARMLAEIGRGNLPPAPDGEPPAFKQTAPNNSGKQARTGKTAAVFNSDH